MSISLCSDGNFSRTACQAPLDHHYGAQTNVLLQPQWGYLQLEGEQSESDVLKQWLGEQQDPVSRVTALFQCTYMQCIHRQ